MKIKSTQQALATVSAMRKALNQLVVQGYDNCYIVAAIGGDLDAVAAFLSVPIADAEEINGEEYDGH